MVATLSTKHPLANEKYLNFNLMNGYDILTLDHSSSSKCFEPFNHEVRLHCPNSNLFLVQPQMNKKLICVLI